jgi:hypothetical protein
VKGVKAFGNAMMAIGILVSVVNDAAVCPCPEGSGLRSLAYG